MANQQFETAADIDIAIEAIMDNSFKGALVTTLLRLDGFKPLGIVPRFLDNGDIGNRFTHPYWRQAHLSVHHHADQKGMATLDRSTLQHRFAQGFVVENGPGHQNLKAMMAEALKEEDHANPLYPMALRQLRYDLLELADDERRIALKVVFQVIGLRNIHMGADTLRTIAASEAGSIYQVLQTLDNDPDLTELTVLGSEQLVPST